MEQANNSFSKGLQMDTHPMVLGNDSLSDALNATFITQNGNEVILLNDMGNRRVDNAYLPPGYEPVGIKEYGGIIYIAAYNPITGKSQIGSFPSPERKISKADDEDLGGRVIFKLDFATPGIGINNDEIYNEINWLITDTLLYPLTNKNSLHAGDKFVVYGFDSGEVNEDITNYFNVNEDLHKVITPLNKTFTLSLGVLNSLNEFVDITSTLVRWNRNDKRIIFNDSDTDLYKFNSGYFIANGLPESLYDLSESINDRGFYEERTVLKLAINTYAYKLIGPLYLKAAINHIELFNYNIYGTYDSDIKTGTLWIEGYLTYNCPHILGSVNNIEDEDYETFDDGIISNMKSYDFYWRNSSELKYLNESSNNKEFNNITTYNKSTNMYSAKITKKFDLISDHSDRIRIDSDSNHIYDFFLGVHAPELAIILSNNKNVYIEGLSIFDSINLSLLGSGNISVIGWRYYNDMEAENTYLTFNIKAYPRYHLQFIDLKMYLYDATKITENNFNNGDLRLNADAEIILANSVYNGRTTTQFAWPTNIKPRKLYYVVLKYKILSTEDPDKYYNIGGDDEIFIPENVNLDQCVEQRVIFKDLYPWFLSTELFNSCYKSGSPDFISCYFNRTTEEEKEIFNRKTLVDIQINPNLTYIDNGYKETTYGLLLMPSDEEGNPLATSDYLSWDYNPVYVNEDSPSIVFNEILGELPEVNKKKLLKATPKPVTMEETLIDDESWITYINGVNSKKSSTENGSNIFTAKYNDPYYIVKNLNLVFLYNPVLYVNNENYYPDYIKANLGVSKNIKQSVSYIYKNKEITSLNTLNIAINSELENNYYNGDISNKLKLPLILITKFNNNTKFEFTLESNAILYCNRFFNDPNFNTERTITNAFNSIRETLPKWLNYTMRGGGTILPEYDAESGPDDGHFITGVAIENIPKDVNGDERYEKADYEYSYKLEVSNSAYGNEPCKDNLALRYNDGWVTFVFNDYKTDIYNFFSKHFSVNTDPLDFLFLFDYNDISDASVKNQGMQEFRSKDKPTTKLRDMSRVWWKTEQGDWALIYSGFPNPKILKALFPNSKELVIKKFIEWLLSFFVTNFVYCFSNNITLRDAQIIAPVIDENYIYNNKYEEEFTIVFNLKLSKDDTNLVSANGAEWALKHLIEFKEKGDVLYNDYHNYTLTPSETFYDIIENLDFENINNIDVSTGKRYDNNKRMLNPSSLYLRKDGLLELYKSNYISIDTSSLYNRYNRVLFKDSGAIGTPLIRYDKDGGENDDLLTFIDYDKSLVTPVTI